MRTLGLLLAPCALALAFSAAAAERPSAAEARGQALVQRNCGMCHATGRTGISPNPAAPPFRNLSQRYKVDDLAEALAEGIITGHPAMPQFRFAPKDVDAIIAYMKAIQARQPASAAPAAEDRPDGVRRRT